MLTLSAEYELVKQIHLPTKHQAWVNNIAGKVASQTCRVWLCESRWESLLSVWITCTLCCSEDSVWGSYEEGSKAYWTTRMGYESGIYKGILL